MNGRCTIDGTILNTIFTNEENGYTVLRLITTDGEIITGVGTIPCAGIIKGVGQATALVLVQRFGERTLQIIEEEPELLSKVRGISERKAREIAESYRYQTGMRRLLDFLAINSLPVSLAVRLYRRYHTLDIDRITALVRKEEQ